MKSVTSQPIKYIMSTHYHADHSGGNTKFLPAAEIISTAMARTNIVEHKQANAPPGMSAGAGDVHAGDGGVSGRQGSAGAVFRPGPHQWRRGDLLSCAAVLHTGDLMAGDTPADRLSRRRQPGGVDQDARRRVAARFRHGDSRHGDITKKAGLLAYRNNVEKLRNR